MKLIPWKKNKNAEEMFPISYRDIEKNVFGHVWGVERNLNKFLKSVFIFHLAMRELIRGRLDDTKEIVSKRIFIVNWRSSTNNTILSFPLFD